MMASLHAHTKFFNMQRTLHLICDHTAMTHVFAPLATWYSKLRPDGFAKSAPFVLHVCCAFIARLRGSLTHRTACLP